MTEREDFLSRWSRRKREAKTEADADAVQATESARSIEPPRSTETQPSNSGPLVEQADAASEFDLSALPSLESIGPGTDVRAFLRAGVPATLSRAALRRAWATDPTIRDFIGLSENSWDFTAPNAIHGFGDIDPLEAQKLFAQLLGGFGGESDTQRHADAASQAGRLSTDGKAVQADAVFSSQSAPSQPTSPLQLPDGATQQERLDNGTNLVQSSNLVDRPPAGENEREQNLQPERRPHGSALPR